MASRLELKSPETMLAFARYNDQIAPPIPLTTIAQVTDVPLTTLRRLYTAAQAKLAEEKGNPASEGDANGKSSPVQDTKAPAEPKSAIGNASEEPKKPAGKKRKAPVNPSDAKTADEMTAATKARTTVKKQKNGDKKIKAEDEDEGGQLKATSEPAGKPKTKPASSKGKGNDKNEAAPNKQKKPAEITKKKSADKGKVNEGIEATKDPKKHAGSKEAAKGLDTALEAAEAHTPIAAEFKETENVAKSFDDDHDSAANSHKSVFEGDEQLAKSDHDAGNGRTNGADGEGDHGMALFGVQYEKGGIEDTAGGETEEFESGGAGEVVAMDEEKVAV